MSIVDPGVAHVPYRPRAAFKPFHRRPNRWAVIVAHRRAGKTVAAVNDAVRAAIRCDKLDGRFAYIAPLYNQAKDVAWDYVKHYARPMLAKPPNKSELRVDLINGSRLRLYGADNPDRLRGGGLDGVILDEYADMKPSVWGEVIRPMLGRPQRLGHIYSAPREAASGSTIFGRARVSGNRCSCFG